MNRIEEDVKAATSQRHQSPGARRGQSPAYLMIADTLSERISTGSTHRVPAASSPQLCASSSQSDDRQARPTTSGAGADLVFQGRGASSDLPI
jgi:hypothetical protein